ncbi:VOC family protein [Xenophilus aerolatus]|nr:VOC family protein [Xenophilus aerolatus]
MPVRKLAHYSVRTADLDASRRFYVDILGFRVGYRPPLDFPGLWLYQGGDDADYGVVHLIGTGGEGSGLADYLGERGTPDAGTGALDHLAFMASGVDEFRDRLARAGVAYRDRTLPGLGLRQLFFVDPSGLTIELNFPAVEARKVPAPTQELQMSATADPCRTHQ